MDQHFSNIIDTLKRLDEAANPAQQAAIAIAMKKAGKKPKHEDSMSDAEQHEHGAKFGGYWKGTQKSPPKPGQGVGSAAEDIELEEELMAEWAKYLDEYGAYGSQPTGTAQTGGAQNPANPQQQQQDADAQKKLTSIVGQAKNKGLLPMTTSTINATQAVAQNPALNKATGQQKQEISAVAANINSAMQKASKNPQAQSDLNTAMSALQRIGKLPG